MLPTARHEIWRFTQEGLNRALDLLRQGLEIVGDNALLYATLGAAYWQHINAGVGPGLQVYFPAVRLLVV